MKLLLVDVPTLALVSCLGGLIMVGTMFGLYVGGTKQRGIIEWGIGGLYFKVGYLLAYLTLILELNIPGWFATTLANNLMGLGHVLILLGVQRYLARLPWNWLLTLPVLMVAVFSISADWRQFPTPLVAETALMVACGGYAAFLLWRARSPGLTAYRRLTATVLALFALFLSTRTAIVLVTSRSFDDHVLQIASYFAGMLFLSILTMVLVLMMFRGKELALRDVERRDSLTGLLSHYALSDISARHYARARRYKESMSLMSIGMDNFKAINDKFGHSGGDQVLKNAAKKLTDELRETDLAFRVGVEEFLVLLPSTGVNEAVLVAGRLRKLIAESSCYFGGHRILRTASFGVAELHPECESFSQALIRAGKALHQAKSNGRNRVCPASEPPADQPLAALDL